jgi:hypothetical protein
MTYNIERLESRKASVDYLYQLITNDAILSDLDSVAIVESLNR